MKLTNMEQQIDELELINAALGEGMRIGAKSPWVKFKYEDRNSWPRLGTWVVGIYISDNKRAIRVKSYIVTMIDEPDGDGGHCWEERRTIDVGIGEPDYWCPLPDPMDYE